VLLQIKLLLLRNYDWLLDDLLSHLWLRQCGHGLDACQHRSNARSDPCTGNRCFACSAGSLSRKCNLSRLDTYCPAADRLQTLFCSKPRSVDLVSTLWFGDFVYRTSIRILPWVAFLVYFCSYGLTSKPGLLTCKWIEITTRFLSQIYCGGEKEEKGATFARVDKMSLLVLACLGHFQFCDHGLTAFERYRIRLKWQL
jgi:hypothetical protein